MGEKRKIRALFDRYRKGTATIEEKQAIANWLQQLDAADRPLSEERIARYAERSRLQLHQRLVQPARGTKVRHIARWVSWAAAACLLLVVANKYLTPSGSAPPAAITGTSHRSQLQLANGTSIYLDNITDSVFTLEGGARVAVHGHEVRYEGVAGKHTIITAPGDRYNIIQADGSRIWVNGASTVRFAGPARMAEVTGEAYFEVSKSARSPFTVKAANRLTIRVLGTAFNVSAWPENDVIQTTLVSGSVQLDDHTRKTLLKPFQKAVYSLRDQDMQVETLTNVDRETDWVYNRLVFRDTPMPEVLARLTRFYNVGFEVKSKRINQYTFTGTFENKPLEKVLEYMQITSNIRYTIRFQQEGGVKKKIIELK